MQYFFAKKQSSDSRLIIYLYKPADLHETRRQVSQKERQAKRKHDEEKWRIKSENEPQNRL
jgi:hypothetical protein